MRKLMVAAVAVLGMTVGFPRAEAKDTPPPSAGTAQPKQGPTDAELDEAHRMNKELDAANAAGLADAKTQVVQGQVESVSGDSLTIRIPNKLNRRMDRLKANAQSRIVKDAQPVTLSALKEGDEVRVSYKIVGSERHLVKVDATSVATPTPAKKTP